MDAGAAAHAYVADVEHPTLTDDDRHHLGRVLRLRDGDTITVGDGRGRWRHCRFGDELAPLDGVVEERAPASLTVAFALTKGDRPEWVVQKLTEIGIDRVVPFRAARSVVRWDEAKSARHHDRLVAVARMAGMQSRRAWLPVVEPVRSFDEVVGEDGVALADAGGPAVDTSVRTIVVGPEGGFDDAERSVAARRVGLGPHVLRAETAAIVAGAALVWAHSGMGSR